MIVTQWHFWEVGGNEKVAQIGRLSQSDVLSVHQRERERVESKQINLYRSNEKCE